MAAPAPTPRGGSSSSAPGHSAQPRLLPPLQSSIPARPGCTNSPRPPLPRASLAQPRVRIQQRLLGLPDSSHTAKPSPAPQTVPLPWTALKGPVPVTEVSQPRTSALTWRNPGLSLLSPGNAASDQRLGRACSAPCVPVQVPAARGAGALQLEFAQECRAKSPGRCTVRARSAAGASWGQAEGLLQCVRTASWTGTAPAQPGLPPENPVPSAAPDTDPRRGWEATAGLAQHRSGRQTPPSPRP